MFTELSEEYRPGNFQLPKVRSIDLEEWIDLTNNWHTVPDGYQAAIFANALLIAVFADAKHVEFVDLFTHRLCLPPAMFLIPVLKRVAKNRGPFVAMMQYGFRSANRWPYMFSVTRTDDTFRRFQELIALFSGNSTGLYDWRNVYQRAAAKILDTHRHDPDLSFIPMCTVLHSMRSIQPYPVMLRSNSEYLIYTQSKEDHNANE